MSSGTMMIAEKQHVENIETFTLTELGEQANQAAEDCDEAVETAVQSAVRCGMLLCAAKGKVPHGQWTAWLSENFTKTPQQARTYMKIAKRKRAFVLGDPASIRDALRKIAGPKEGSPEDREDKIADMLRAGKTQSEIAVELHVQNSTVRRIYQEEVMPELLEVDWRATVKKAAVKPIAAVKLKLAIGAEYHNAGMTGGVYEWLCSEINVTIAQMIAAKKIVTDGIPNLVARAESGEIALTTAAALAKKTADVQAKELATMDRKSVIDVASDLRSRVSLMLDQKLGWNTKYGKDTNVFRDLRNTANSDELSEITRSLLLVRDWTGTIATLLGE